MLTGGETPYKCFIIITMKSVDAKKLCLKGILTEDFEYVIPFFQRRYSWEKEDWEKLWDSILSIYNGDREKEYFMGCILTKEEDISPLNRGKREINLVDGQQRMVTLSILLKALQNECNANGNIPLKSEIEGLLYLGEGAQSLRVRCSELDRARYKSFMDSTTHKEVKPLDNENQDRMFECYKFFQEKIQATDSISKSSAQNKLARIIIGSQEPSNSKSLVFITVYLNSESNEQEIFDTINSYGVDLRASELIKNFVFNARFWEDRDKAEEAYEEYWCEEFESYEEIGYWDKLITRGRGEKHHNLESFLHSFLLVTRSIDNYSGVKKISMSDLFREYKELVKDYHKQSRLDELLKNLNAYAKTYQKYFLDITGRSRVSFSEFDKRLFITLKRINLTTADPLILYHYHNYKNKSEIDNFIRVLDSYLVRRAICDLPLTRSVLIEPLIKIANEGVSFNDFIQNIPEDDPSSFPSNEKFKQYFFEKAHSHNYSFLLLYSIALKQLQNSLDEKVKYSLSVEHILPKAWQKNWKRRSMSYEEINERDRSKKLIGNLTLVNKRLNSSLSNKGWAEKKIKLEERCLLTITTDFLDEDEWDEKTIDVRAKKLFSVAIKVWPNLGK